MFKTIRAKLVWSYALILVVMMGVSATTYTLTESNARLTEEAIDKDFNGSVAIASLAVEGQKIRRFEKEYFIYIGDTKNAKKYETEWKDTFKKIRSQLTDLIADHERIWTDQEKAEFGKWEVAADAYRKGFLAIVDGVSSGAINNTLVANAAIQEGKDAFRVLLDGTAKIGATKLKHARDAEKMIVSANNTLERVLLISVVGSLIFCLGLAIVVPGAITNPINTLSDAASTMSKGDLQKSVPSMAATADFVGLAEALERMRISLKLMIDRATSPDQRATGANRPIAGSTGQPATR
jgi:HAMP domain-containing protein